MQRHSLLILIQPDRRQALKAKPLRGGADRAGLDRLPSLRSGLYKQTRTDWGRGRGSHPGTKGAEVAARRAGTVSLE